MRSLSNRISRISLSVLLLNTLLHAFPINTTLTPSTDNSTQLEYDYSINTGDIVYSQNKTYLTYSSSPTTTFSSDDFNPQYETPPQAYPRPLESVGGQSTLAPANAEENLSLDELKRLFQNATDQMNRLNASIEAKRSEIAAKEREAIEPNRIYEEKLKEWKRLEKIAKEESKNFTEKTGAANKANDELSTANSTLARAKTNFELAKKALADWPERVKNAESELQRMNNVPKNLTETTARKEAKKDGKPALETNVETLKQAVDASTNGPLKTAQGDVVTAQGKYDDAQCLEPAQNSTQNCVYLLTVLNDANSDLVKAKEAHDLLVKAWDGPRKELENYDTDMQSLSDQVDDLTTKSDSLDLYKGIAQKAVQKLKGQEPTLKENVNSANQTLQLAIEDFDSKLEAKNNADAALLGLPDGATASQAASNAKHDMNLAKIPKNTIEGEVSKLKGELEALVKSHSEAKTAAQRLQERYETAKRKEEQSQKGITTGAIAGIAVGVVLFLAVVAVLVFFCIRRKWYKKISDKFGGGPKPKPSQSTTKASSKVSNSGTVTDAQRLASPVAPASPQQPSPAAPLAAAPDQKTTIPSPEKVKKAKHYSDPLPDLAKTKYDPDDNWPRVTIPATDFIYHKAPDKPPPRLSHGPHPHKLDLEPEKAVWEVPTLWFGTEHHVYEKAKNFPPEDYPPDSDPIGTTTEREGFTHDQAGWEKRHREAILAGKIEPCKGHHCDVCTPLPRAGGQPAPPPPTAAAAANPTTPQAEQSPAKPATGKKGSSSKEKKKGAKPKEEEKPRK